MHIFKKFILSLLFLSYCNFQSQYVKEHTYAQIDELIDGYNENDVRAMVFVNLFIKKAKKENNLSKLIAGYDEAVYYEPSADRKIKYADSAVSVALKMKDSDKISMSYLKKGIVYYYNKRNYNNALKEYLTAFKYSKDTENHYLQNKILYHLGMVKCYLGFYEEASIHFKETARYYEAELNTNRHPNLKLNSERGFLNSVYRLSTCYRNLKLYKKEDSLISIGLKAVKNSEPFLQEFAYFQKAEGIRLIRIGRFDLAAKYLINAEEILKSKNDFAALAAVYFYQGKLNFKNKKESNALVYFKKVDSILNKYNFVTPEVINNYKYLIQFAKNKGDNSLQLDYTNKLLRADSIITSDFSVLSAKIYRELVVHYQTRFIFRLFIFLSKINLFKN